MAGNGAGRSTSHGIPWTRRDKIVFVIMIGIGILALLLCGWLGEKPDERTGESSPMQQGR